MVDNRINFAGVPSLTEKEIFLFEKTLRNAEDADEIKALFKNKLKIANDEHLNFLIEKGRENAENIKGGAQNQKDGSQKLREFYYEVLKFDLMYGTSTSSYISEELYKQIALEDPARLADPNKADHGVKHRSSLTSVITDSFNKAVRILETNGYDPKEASFFDLGSGQGKSVLIAASKLPEFNFGFKRAVGVDYFSDVINAANLNLKNNKLDIDPNKVTFVFRDAAEFSDFNGTNVIYTYNSFDLDIMKEVERTLRKYGGKTLLIYNKPLHEQRFLDKGWTQECKIDDVDPDKQYSIYTMGLHAA